MKKLISVTVILLFIGIAFAPSINANVGKEGIVRIRVTEYKEDGSTEKKIIEMLNSEYIEFRNKLQNNCTPKRKFTLYKEYNLIPQNVTLDQLKTGMEEKVRKFGLTNEKFEKKENLLTKEVTPSLNTIVKVLNFNCLVDGFVGMGIRLYLGSSRITALINGWIGWYDLKSIPYIPSVDLMQMGFTFVGWLHTEDGDLPNNGEHFVILFYLIMGFVGYVAEFPGFRPYFPRITGAEQFLGYAGLVSGIGGEFYVAP